MLCATSNDCEAPQPRCSEAPSGVRQGAAGAYSSATMMNRQRFALCSAPIYFPSTCKRTPSADCTWPKGPLNPHSVGHAHVHSWTSLQHIGSNFQINNIYIYICSTYRPRNYLRLFGCNDLWDYCNNHELITTHQENLG